MRTFIIGAFVAIVIASAVSPVLAQSEDLRSQRPPGDGPTDVEISFYMMDLMKVIDRDEAFEADIFVIAMWKDPRQAGEKVRIVPASEVWKPNAIIFNQRDLESDLPRVVEIQPDGTVRQRLRLTGTFASKFDLKRFPQDTQTLFIRIVVYGATVDEVRLVESSDFPASRNPELAISDWDIGEVSTSTEPFRPIPAAPVLSTMTISVEGRRLIGYYVVQMLIPLILIVGMAWSVFWIDPSVIPTRMSVSVTTILTLIAYRFMIGGLVPKLPYLTTMDYVLLGTTLLVAAGLVAVAAGSYLVGHDQIAPAKLLNRIGRVAFPVIFILMFLGLGLFR